jgi:hypothetical protein
VERAFDMIQMRTGDASMLEAGFVRNAQIFIISNNGLPL